MESWFSTGFFLLLLSSSWLFSKLMVVMSNEYWKPKTYRFWKVVNACCQVLMLIIMFAASCFFMKS